MARISSYLLGAGTLACALGIGYFMQYGFAMPDRASGATKGVHVTEVTLTSSALAAPRLPGEAALQGVLPDGKVELTAAEPMVIEGFAPPSNSVPSAGFACTITMQADPAAGAMVALTLDAPCNASGRVTIHHSGLMFTEVVQPDGTLQVDVPAMAERATFIASFVSGEGATAAVDVTSLEFYDRVAVQWKGDAGLQLHAREFTDSYFGKGHVWAASAGSLETAVRGEGGFLTRLGRSDAPDALVAEIYTFPTGTSRQAGDVLLTVEAEITQRNCNDTVEAQTLELRDQGALRVRDLSVDMPDCDTAGDFLVLKNLVEDLKIAAK